MMNAISEKGFLGSHMYLEMQEDWKGISYDMLIHLYNCMGWELDLSLIHISSTFEVVEEVTYVYSCPKCGAMIRPEKEFPLIKGSIATPSLVAGIMNAKYVNGMPLARQEREFARYD